MTPLCQLSALDVLESMYLTRFADEKMSKLVRQNKGATFHLSSLGHEMVGVVFGKLLESGTDWALPYYRDRALAISLGCPLKDLFAAFLARKCAHHSAARQMPEHFSDKTLRIPCQSSCVGSQFLQAVGVARAVQLAKREEVVYVSGGDGSTSQGDFHEALNYACLHRLPLLFVIQDNGWAISVPLEEQVAGGSIAARASGYPNLAIFDIDGCDFTTLSQAGQQATCRARSGEGPSLIIAKVPRLGAHSSSDDPLKYKDQETIDEEKSRDPLRRMEAWALAVGLLSKEELEALAETCFHEVERAAVDADNLPFADIAEAEGPIFAPAPEIAYKEEEECCSAEGIVIMDALNHALDEEMAIDDRVVIFGQDVAHGKGGVFGITRLLTEKYGKQRCFNTPLAESTIIGMALGLSLAHGFKPVAEIQFADYLWTGINQLFNELASIYYRSNGEWNCPVVIRMPYGGYIQGGPYHSQSIEAFLAHCPGLKVVIPSNAADAKRLLKTAIRDPNPVVFLEHKALYRQRLFCARKETGGDELLPFGKAAVVRKGSDLTLIGWGMMVAMGAEIVDKLAKEGISVELLDLRTLVPLDEEAILASVKKTGKVLIAHEAAKSGGFGAEIASRITEKAFAYLDAPPLRLAGKQCPVPYSKELESAVLPQKEDLERAIRSLHIY